MNFIEEKTPGGFLLKIMFDNWQFMAFDKKGKSIYVSKEGKGLLHSVPVIVFVGPSLGIRKEYNRDYSMLKIRDGLIVVPYRDIRENKKKYFFINTDKDLDSIPVRMRSVHGVAQMVREIDIALKPDYVVVDDSITANDVIIIKNRYKVEEIIYVELANNYFLAERLKIPDFDRVVNLNMMSTNPVFLARIHLRTMDLSKINQLLLDFDISALDTEYILHFIEDLLAHEDKDESVKKNKPRLADLRDSFKFYMFLLQKKDDEIRSMIDAIKNPKKVVPYRTLISKVKSIYPGSEEQILYTEYENTLLDRQEALQGMTAR